MFILRRITSENNQMNDCLGDRYHEIYKETQKEEFEKAKEAIGWKSITEADDGEELYGFICHMQGSQMIHYPLYKKSVYFIMTESGKTFDNITYK